MIDLTGKKFGRLTVIKKVGSNRLGSLVWLCKCECGTEKIINGRNLRGGETKSCGCLAREITKVNFAKMLENRRLKPGVACMRASIRSYKSHAKKLNLKWGLTEEQFKEITQKDCFYCGAKPNNIGRDLGKNGDYIYNGIDRVENNKGYIIDNVVPCCRRCNTAKKNSTLQEFQDWIKRVYNNLRQKEMT